MLIFPLAALNFTVQSLLFVAAQRLFKILRLHIKINVRITSTAVVLKSVTAAPTLFGWVWLKACGLEG